MQERSKRITASNFGRIVKATDRVDMSALLNSLLRPRKLDNVPAIKHGRKYESVALAAYSKQTGQTVVGCGLFICPTNSFLAATPDGLVEPALLVEVKCPYTRRDEAITPITVPYLKECDSGLQLDHKHDYYHQIQGQLMITGKKRCDLVVYTKVDMKVIQINEDKPFQHEMTTKLHRFFKDHFKAALLELYFFKRYSRYNFD